jgi:hypothetical protein
MKIWPFYTNGFIDNVCNKDRRRGLVFIKMGGYSNTYTVVVDTTNYDIILEVVEIYNDQKFSKVEVIAIPYYVSKYKLMRIFNPWIDTKKIHWLLPSIFVDRDNKLRDILK